MLRSFKAPKRTMRSERKRTRCPTLIDPRFFLTILIHLGPAIYSYAEKIPHLSIDIIYSCLGLSHHLFTPSLSHHQLVFTVVLSHHLLMLSLSHHLFTQSLSHHLFTQSLSHHLLMLRFVSPPSYVEICLTTYLC